MSGHVCIQASEKCYNLYESYGEICVGCGCCSSDKQTRLASRIELHKRLIEQEQKFDNWCDDPDLRAFQEQNVAENIEFSKRVIAAYEAELERGQKHAESKAD